MNRRLLSLAKSLLGVLPLLLVSLPASAASDLGGLIPPPSGTSTGPAPVAVQYPFASVSATELTRSTRIRHHHHHHRTAFRRGAIYRSTLQYRIHFKLNSASDGLAPPGENMLLTAAPDPSSPQAAQTPSFQIYIPSGCFVDLTHHQRRYTVNGLDCGADVRLHDPATMMDTSLNDFVRHFRVSLLMRRNGVAGQLQVRINFAGFNAPDNVNADGVLSLTLGNDGVTQLPMKAPQRRRGRVTLSHS